MRDSSRRATNIATRNRLISIILGLIAFAFIFLLFLSVLAVGRKVLEKFKAESFAADVLAQNPKVFERLAEM